MTVDWSLWMTATPDEQRELWRDYRRAVKQESDAARISNYRAMSAAMAQAGAAE
jgi:hypothetical protein